MHSKNNLLGPCVPLFLPLTTTTPFPYFLMATFVPRASPAPLAHVRALHDFSSTEPGTLKFRKGDQIAVFIKLSSGWWDGSLGEKRGWFPSNYVTELSDFQADPDLEILTTASSGERRRSSSAGVNPADDGIDARVLSSKPIYHFLIISVKTNKVWTNFNAL